MLGSYLAILVLYLNNLLYNSLLKIDLLLLMIDEIDFNMKQIVH